MATRRTKIFDIENRLTRVNHPTLGTHYYQFGYDTDNRRVMRVKTAGAQVTTEVHFYWQGKRLGRYTLTAGFQTTQEDLYIGQYRVAPQDRLASAADARLLPYGEELSTTSQDRVKFATYFRDEWGYDYADQRYHAQGRGRFLTPDPYIASGSTGNPSSWNRYAYVIGDPVNLYDPAGLDYRIDDVRIFNPGHPGNVRAGDTSVTVTTRIIEVPVVPSSTAGLADWQNPWWQAEQDARENNCAMPNGMSCWDYDRQREEEERSRRNAEKCSTRAIDENETAFMVLGVSLVASAPIIPKELVVGRSIGTPDTSLLSVAGHIFKLTMSGLGAVDGLNTSNVLRFAGRAAFPVAVGLAVATAVETAKDFVQCYEFEMSHPYPGER